MSKITPEQIHNAMFSSQEGYVAYVIDSIEFDLGRILADEEQRSVAQFVDGVITTNANVKEAGEVARAALDYIDAIPAEIVATFPVMPGFDRDWAEKVLAGGVPGDVLEQAAPIDRHHMVDMSGIELPEDAERKEAFIDAMRARDMGGFTDTQLIAHIMDKAARIKPDRQIDNEHRKEALMNLRILEIALAALMAPDDVPRPVMDGICDMSDGGVDAQGIWDLCKAAIINGVA